MYDVGAEAVDNVYGEHGQLNRGKKIKSFLSLKTTTPTLFRAKSIPFY